MAKRASVLAYQGHQLRLQLGQVEAAGGIKYNYLTKILQVVKQATGEITKEVN